MGAGVGSSAASTASTRSCVLFRSRDGARRTGVEDCAGENCCCCCCCCCLEGEAAAEPGVEGAADLASETEMLPAFAGDAINRK